LPPNSHTIEKLTPKEREEHRTAKREAAVRLWERLSPIRHGYEAANYLKARGLESFIGLTALRCAGPTFHRPTGDWRPTLAARMYHVHYGLCAVQLTYLKWDGSDRARSIKPGRMTYGSMEGGAVWIRAPRGDEEFVVAEGLETCLSAMLLLNLRCGAAVLGAHMRDLVFPNAARNVHIAADNDETGRKAAEYTAKIWRARGLKVRVSVPDTEGQDFNDVLLGKGVKQ